MFGVMYLYLFEGPRAVRMALWTIIGSSLLYVAIVYLLNLQVDTVNWIQFTVTRAWYYLSSLLAIFVDIIVLAIGWELLSKFKKMNLVVRVFLIMLLVLALDTFIFVTMAFGGSEIYISMLKSNLVLRLILSAIGAPIMSYFLKIEGFMESKRDKPKNYWEILNFRSDLENKILTLEDMIEKHKELEDRLIKTEETYSLALNGSGAGIWDWNVVTNDIIWSPKFCSLLGYSPGEFTGNLEAFKQILHPDDMKQTFELVDKCFANGERLETVYRLKMKSGKYAWFSLSGIVKFDENHKPVRMVGSIIDISLRKEAELAVQKKVDELTQMNDLMINRELAMVELKKKIGEN